MRALQFRAYGGPEVLEWGEAPDPHAGPGQVRITVRAASVNPIDWKAMSGVMSRGEPMQGTGYLGYDAAGVVDEVGEGVTGVSVGDEVFGRGRSTQAESAVLDAWAAKAPSIDWAVAAAAGVAGETAERWLRLLEVNAGDTLFVDGGAGGVGAATVQLALGGSGFSSGSQMCSGTDWPAQCRPHSWTHRRRSASEVRAGSNTTVAVCATGLASTRSTPGRRPSTASTTAFSEPRSMGCTSRTAVVRFGSSIRSSSARIGAGAAGAARNGAEFLAHGLVCGGVVVPTAGRFTPIS
jgi:hypothetical protein